MRTATRCGAAASRSRCHRRNSSCSGTSWATPTGCCPRCRSSTTSGITTSAGIPASWSPTSRCCGARSTVLSRTCCTRCAASGTYCGSRRPRRLMAMSSAGAIGRAWQWLRALPDRTPLRVKMITAVLALVIIALGVISFASQAVYRGYLVHQARNQLVQYNDQVLRYINYLNNSGGDGHFGHFALFNNGLDRTWFLGPSGQQLQLMQAPQPGWTPPQVPINRAWL